MLIETARQFNPQRQSGQFDKPLFACQRNGTTGPKSYWLNLHVTSQIFSAHGVKKSLHLLGSNGINGLVFSDLAM